MKLRYKITGLIFAILLVLGVAGAAVMLHFQRQNAYSQFEESALVLAEVLYESLVHDMKEANQEHIQDAVALIAARSSINEVVIFGNAQNIYASGETSEIGQMRNDDEIAEACSPVGASLQDQSPRTTRQSPLKRILETLDNWHKVIYSVRARSCDDSLRKGVCLK